MTDLHVEEWAQRLLAGDRRALARAISGIERGEADARAIVGEIYPHTGDARVSGFTGPPGVGKSTLVGALTKRLRDAGRTVAILAVDPSSPFTSGALLGDRIRLGEHEGDDGVYMRSLAARGALGGLSHAVPEAIAALDAAGFQDILLETVGVGQSETDVAGIADVVTLVLMPGAGDETQMIKAGIMEVPDVIAVNRSDEPGSRAYAARVRRTVNRSPSARRVPEVLQTQALDGEGVSQLLEAIERAHGETAETGGERRRCQALRTVLALALARLGAELTERLRTEPAAAELLDRLLARELDPQRVTELLLAGLPAGAGREQIGGCA